MKDLFGEKYGYRNLRGRYGEPPFSVLDTKQKLWVDRRHQWLNMGIKSEIGRNSSPFTDGLRSLLSNSKKSSTRLRQKSSIFDPVLCELMYKWFCPEKGRILDPFAGGSVRGIVAACMDLEYVGIDLSEKQIEANKIQANSILNKQTLFPSWLYGDSEKKIPLINQKFSFIFSCPPYMNLEKFSNHPDDLSNMRDDCFIDKYRNIIRLACQLLKSNCFACFVVGEVRDKKGHLKDFVSITKEAFYQAGLRLWNEIILLNPVGSAAMRAGKFDKSKKVVRIHQTILVFRKGEE